MCEVAKTEECSTETQPDDNLDFKGVSQSIKIKPSGETQKKLKDHSNSMTSVHGSE